MSDYIHKERIISFLEKQLDAIEKYNTVNGKNNIYYVSMERDRVILNALLLKIYAGEFD